MKLPKPRPSAFNGELVFPCEVALEPGKPELIASAVHLHEQIQQGMPHAAMLSRSFVWMRVRYGLAQYGMTYADRTRQRVGSKLWEQGEATVDRLFPEYT